MLTLERKTLQIALVLRLTIISSVSPPQEEEEEEEEHFSRQKKKIRETKEFHERNRSFLLPWTDD